MRQTTREKKAHDSNRKIDSVDHINGIEILEDWKRRFRCTGGGGGIKHYTNYTNARNTTISMTVSQA